MNKRLPGESRGRGALTLISEIGGVVGFIALIVTLGLSGSVRDVVVDGVRWLWPIGVVAILTATVLLLGLLLHRASRRVVVVPPVAPRAADLAFDRDLVQDLKHSLPRETITWFREHDFGGAWAHDQLRPLDFMVHERDEVEHRFHDVELERRRAALLSAIKVFRREAAHRAGVDRRGRYSISAWDESPSDASFEERETAKEESRTTLNAAADVVAKAYDDVLQGAREHGVLGASRSWTD
jgi:hypothetical protein